MCIRDSNNGEIVRINVPPLTEERRKELVKEAKKEAEELADAKVLKEKLESGNYVVEIKAKAGTDGRLFGSITSKQIAQAMEKQHGLKIDKRKMELAAPIRAMGYANVPVKLHNEVSAKIRVHISEQ